MTPPPSDPNLPALPLYLCGNLPFGGPLAADAPLPGTEARDADARSAGTRETDAPSRQGGANRWAPGQSIAVGFWEPATDPWVRYFRELVTAAVREWEKYANLHFTFVEGNGDITVTFTQGAPNRVSSELGTDSARVRPSMHLIFQRNGDPGYVQYMKAICLHEFGHALGLVHEHQLAFRPIQFLPNMRNAYRQTYPSATDGYIDSQILAVAAVQLQVWDTFDRDSVMMYPIPQGCAVDDVGNPFVVGQNATLSDGDKAFIAKMYPGGGGGGGNGPHPDPALTLGKEVTDHLDQAGQVRQYNFKLDATQLVQFRTGGTGVKKVRLLGPDDPTTEIEKFIAGNDGNVNTKGSYDAGTYYLEVSLPDGTGPYQLTVSLVAG